MGYTQSWRGVSSSYSVKEDYFGENEMPLRSQHDYKYHGMILRSYVRNPPPPKQLRIRNRIDDSRIVPVKVMRSIMGWCEELTPIKIKKIKYDEIICKYFCFKQNLIKFIYCSRPHGRMRNEIRNDFSNFA